MRVVDEPGDELGVRSALFSDRLVRAGRDERRLTGNAGGGRGVRRRGKGGVLRFGFARRDEAGGGLFEVSVGVRTTLGQLREDELLAWIEVVLNDTL